MCLRLRSTPLIKFCVMKRCLRSGIKGRLLLIGVGILTLTYALHYVTPILQKQYAVQQFLHIKDPSLQWVNRSLVNTRPQKLGQWGYTEKHGEVPTKHRQNFVRGYESNATKNGPHNGNIRGSNTTERHFRSVRDSQGQVTEGHMASLQNEKFIPVATKIHFMKTQRTDKAKITDGDEPMDSEPFPHKGKHSVERGQEPLKNTSLDGEKFDAQDKESEDTATIPADANHQASSQEPTLVVILAYMHTGSTYVGSIFQNHPDTFYEYEPLRSLQAESKYNRTIVFLNGTTRYVSGDRVDPALGSWAVEAMLRCAHAQLDITTLVKYYFRLNSLVMRDTATYFACLKVRQWYDTQKASIIRRQALVRKVFFSPLMESRIRRCLPYLVNKCKTATIRTSKFIRMGMEIGERLLKSLPNLKIIHLLRDPRAMMDSQVRKGDMGTRHMHIFEAETKKMCAHMLEDIRLRYKLQQRFPGRIMEIHYEDILEYPILAARAMFNFTGLPFLKTDLQFVKRYSVDHGATVEVRESVWKNHLQQDRLDILNKYCFSVFTELGYITYAKIQELRNASNPTYTIDYDRLAKCSSTV